MAVVSRKRSITNGNPSPDGVFECSQPLERSSLRVDAKSAVLVG